MSSATTSRIDASTRTGEPGLSGAYCDLNDLMRLRWVAKTFSLPKAKRVSRPQAGTHFSRFRGRGMEFSEVRAYQPGDDVRSIDWRVTARRQKPHTKLFNEERERPIFLLCDQSQPMFFGSKVAFKSVRAAETAALFAWTALNHNDRVGGIVYSGQGHEEFRPSRDRKSILRLLSQLAHYNRALSAQSQTPEKAFRLNDALTECSRIVKPGSLVMIISDFSQIDEETHKHLALMAQHNDLILANVFDPLERELPPPGFYPVSNGVDTLILNARSEQARKSYLSWSKTQQETLAQIALQCRAPLVHISTHHPATAELRGILTSLS